MHGQPVAVLRDAAEPIDVGDVELRIDALREQVHGQRDNVHVARALAVAEQRALDPIRAGQHAELGGGHRAAAVVVRMERQHQAVAARDLAEEPLDRVGVEVRRVHLHRRGQVEDDLLIRRRLDDVHHRLADLDGELHLGAGVALGRVLVEDLRVAHRLLELPAELGRVHRDVHDAGLVEAEHDAALQDRRRVVEVHDRAPGARETLVRAVDQLRPALHQHLDDDVVGDEVLLDQQADEVVVGLGRGGEADLDLLESHLHQRLEHAPLALGVHRVDERLVAVPQVHRAPARRLRQLLVRPGPIAQIEGDEGHVPVERHRLRSRGLWWHVAPRVAPSGA